MSFLRRTPQKIVPCIIHWHLLLVLSDQRPGNKWIDSASANMAMRPLIIEFLTEEQKQTRERHNASINLAWLGNYLIENQEREMQAVARSARTAYKEPTFDGHHAMPAIIAQDNALYHTHPTPLAQRG